ncbi:MAG: SRPBCC domain-containing protein [Chitinophagaceae bacterium]
MALNYTTMYKIIITCFTSLILIACGQQKKENTVLSESLESVTGKLNILSDSIMNGSFVSENGEKFLRYEMVVDTPITEVWKAIATEEGIKTWMAPVAKLDLKTGGIVQTNYSTNAKIGDAGTISLGIINYIPEEMLIYQITLNDVFPEKCRNEDKNLQEIIQLKPLSKNKTKVTSTMVGWGQGKEWDETYTFFEKGNKWSYQQLVTRFKNGPVKWN